MALDFPSSPTDGQTYSSGEFTWVYQGATGAWIGSNMPGDYVGINTQTGSYTFVLADKGKLVVGNSASALTFTVPPNSSVPINVRGRIDIAQTGAGQVSVAAGAGVTIRSSSGKLKLTGQYSAASLTKIATDEWLLFGDITA